MKYQNILKYSLFGMIAAFYLAGCSKMDDSIAPYIKDGEIIYATRPDTLKLQAGNKRIKLSWKYPPNRTAVKAVVYWNNMTQSKEIPTTGDGQAFETILDNMTEGTYLFDLYTFDSAGNRSIKTVATGSVYGTNFQNTIYNRTINSNSATVMGTYIVKWGATSAGQVGTTLTYTNTMDETKTLEVPSTDVETVIPDFKPGSELKIQSNYLPEPTAIDIFKVLLPNSVPLPAAVPSTSKYSTKGKRVNYNANGTVASTNDIAIEKQLDKTTTDHTYSTDDIANLANFANSKMTLSVNPDNTISISGYISGTTMISNYNGANASYYDPKTGNLYLSYQYTNANGTYRLIEEVLSPK